MPDYSDKCSPAAAGPGQRGTARGGWESVPGNEEVSRKRALVGGIHAGSTQPYVNRALSQPAQTDTPFRKLVYSPYLCVPRERV